MMMLITEKVKKIIRTNQMDINQVLSLVCRSKAKERRMPLLNASNPPGKDPAVEINGFKGVEHEWLVPKKEESLFAFWKSKI